MYKWILALGAACMLSGCASDSKFGHGDPHRNFYGGPYPYYGYMCPDCYGD